MLTKAHHPTSLTEEDTMRNDDHHHPHPPPPPLSRGPTFPTDPPTLCHPVPPAQPRHNLPKPATNPGMQNKPTDPHSLLKIHDSTRRPAKQTHHSALSARR